MRLYATVIFMQPNDRICKIFLLFRTQFAFRLKLVSGFIRNTIGAFLRVFLLAIESLPNICLSSKQSYRLIATIYVCTYMYICKYICVYIYMYIYTDVYSKFKVLEGLEWN